MMKILHLLMSSHPSLNPTYITMIMDLNSSVMSTIIIISPGWGLTLILPIIPIVFPQCMIKNHSIPTYFDYLLRVLNTP